MFTNKFGNFDKYILQFGQIHFYNLQDEIRANPLWVLLVHLCCWDKYISTIILNMMIKMEIMNDVHDDDVDVDDDSEAWKGVGGQSLLGAPAGPGSH